MKTIKTITISCLLIILAFKIPLFLKPLYALQQPSADLQRRRAELQARAVLRGLKAAVELAEKEIKNSLSRSSDIQNLYARIDAAQKSIQDIKDRAKITPYETQLDSIKAQIDTIATQIYAASISRGESLYLPISKYIKDITENPIIRRNLVEIFDRLQEIKRQMGGIKERIRATGRQISTLTRSQKFLIKQEKSKMLPIQMEIDKILLQEGINNQLETLNQNILEYKNQIERYSEALTESEKDEIEKLKNIRNRYQIMLEFLRDPDKIQTINDEQLLGLTPPTEND